MTTLDLVLLIAGFACGLVLHQNSALGHGRLYILPSGIAPFRSLLGRIETAWFWALVVGLAFCATVYGLPVGVPMVFGSWIWGLVTGVNTLNEAKQQNAQTRL